MGVWKSNACGRVHLCSISYRSNDSGPADLGDTSIEEVEEPAAVNTAAPEQHSDTTGVSWEEASYRGMVLLELPAGNLERALNDYPANRYRSNVQFDPAAARTAYETRLKRGNWMKTRKG